MSDSADRAPEVRTSRLVLVDDAGRERAVLEMRKGQPILQLFGSNGRAQVQIGVVSEWDGVPLIYLESPEVTSFVELAATQAGNAAIQLGASRRRIWVYSNKDGQPPAIELTDDHGRLIARLPALLTAPDPGHHPPRLIRPPDLAGEV